MLWLASARSLAGANRTALLLVLAAAWLATLTAAMRRWKQAFGVTSPAYSGEQTALAEATRAKGRVPIEARVAPWVSALGLIARGAARVWRG